MTGDTLSDLARQDVIDGRDIENRIDDIDVDFRHDDDGELLDEPTWDDETAKEYEALLDVRGTVEDYAEDTLRNTTLLADSYMPRYAEQYADDIGAINEAASSGRWPLMHIDWEAAADDLKSDYSSVELDGRTYWFR